MTDDIRDRLAEWIETHRSYDPESFGTIVESLAALVGEMLLAERAAALGAAGDVLSENLALATRARDRADDGDTIQSGGAGEGMEARLYLAIEAEIIGEQRDFIHSLSPEGWVGVREADLAVVKEAAQAALVISEGSVTGVDDAEISIVNAALARMP